MTAKLPQVVAGIPYGPDIRKLEEAFPSPQEEQIITSDEIEKVINTPQKTGRFYGVVNAWRKRLMSDRGIDSDWIQGVGVKILTPSDRQKVSEQNIKQGIRKTNRAFRRHAMVPRDRLDEIGQKRHDHTTICISKLASAMREAKKELAIDLAPVKSLPKPKLVVNE